MLASKPIRDAVRFEFDPETSVTVTVPDGPNDPVGATLMVRGVGVGFGEVGLSEQAALPSTARASEAAMSRCM